MDAAVFDGVHVRRKDGLWPNVAQVVAEVREIAGWPKFSITWKPFAVHADLPVQGPPAGGEGARPCCPECSAAPDAPVQPQPFRDTDWVARRCETPGCGGQAGTMAAPGSRGCVRCGPPPRRQAAQVQHGPAEAPVYHGVSVTRLREMWATWRGAWAADDGDRRVFGDFIAATRAELKRLGGETVALRPGRCGAAAIHPALDG